MESGTHCFALHKWCNNLMRKRMYPCWQSEVTKLSSTEWTLEWTQGWWKSSSMRFSPNDFAEAAAASVLSEVKKEGKGANRLPLCMQMTVSWRGRLPARPMAAQPQPQPLRPPACPSHYLKWDEVQTCFHGLSWVWDSIRLVIWFRFTWILYNFLPIFSPLPTLGGGDQAPLLVEEKREEKFSQTSRRLRRPYELWLPITPREKGDAPNKWTSLTFQEENNQGEIRRNKEGNKRNQTNVSDITMKGGHSDPAPPKNALLPPSRR